MKESCELCKFARQSGTKCQRYPPRYVEPPSPYMAGGRAEAVFTDTTPGAWCGEFAQAPEPELVEKRKPGRPPKNALAVDAD